MPRIRHYRAFTAEWFRRNLTRLCWAFNAHLLGRWLRRGLGLRRDGRVVDIRPECVVIETSPNRFEYTGWTGDVVSEYVYEVAKPLWWAIHYWDEWIADRWLPELSYGFDTLTTYTQSGSASTRAFDIFIQADANTFSAARAKPPLNPETATFLVWESIPNVDPGSDIQASCSRGAVDTIGRGFLHFDVSSLAGPNLQNIPGTVTVDSAYVLCVQAIDPIKDPSGIRTGLYLTQSTIDPYRTSTTVVGSDFRQTPLTTFSIGTNPLQLGQQTTLTLVPGSTARPIVYQWVFQSAAFAEIEAYYYPADPPGSRGAHNGLARFCVKHDIDFNNVSISGEYFSGDLFISRERASSTFGFTSNGVTRNVLHAPRLNVEYTVSTIINATSLPEPPPTLVKFGVPEVISPRQINATGFRPYAVESSRFGLLTIPPLSFEVVLQSLVNPTVRFGSPLIPVVFASGLSDTATFGIPVVLSGITPTGIASTLAFGLPALGPSTDRFVQVRGLDNKLTFNNEVRQIFGRPFVEGVELNVRPTGIASTLRFGARWYIGQPFPETVYISRLIDVPVEYQRVVHEFENGRVDVNVQICGVRSWRIEYEGISEEDVDILVQHFREVRGRVGRFPFYHRRDDVVYEDCYYTAFDIPARIKKWANNVSITIERQE